MGVRNRPSTDRVDVSLTLRLFSISLPLVIVSTFPSRYHSSVHVDLGNSWKFPQPTSRSLHFAFRPPLIPCCSSYAPPVHPTSHSHPNRSVRRRAQKQPKPASKPRASPSSSLPVPTPSLLRVESTPRWVT
jgi:hypothetical protein